MKYLGIDYGSKFVGTATSDRAGKVAMPQKIWPNHESLLFQLADMIEQEKIDAIVVGESANLSGGHNNIQKEIETFSRSLAEQAGVPVHSSNEVFSSRQAKWGIEHPLRANPRNTRNTKGIYESRVDARAAAIILQSYLDQQG